MAETPAFGTSGLRGLAEQLTDGLCAAYAQAFTEMTGADVVMIARDLRESSPRIARAVAFGVVQGGARAVDCGVAPTPALALAAGAHSAAGIMVTGSHIPGNRNGLKFYRGADEIDKDDEKTLRLRVEDIATRDDVETVETEEQDAAGDFVERYTRFFGPGALDGLRIGVWEHSSTARDVLPELLGRLGAEVVSLERSDAFVAIDTEAVSDEVRGRLSTWSSDHDLDAIVSTDGDADRPLLTDETGAIVQGDILGTLTTRFLEADGVATPISSNTMIDGIGVRKVQRTRIGSPYVIAAMQDLRDGGYHRVVGFEPNGGFLLGFDAKIGGRHLMRLETRDFALPILATLAAARERKATVSELVGDLPGRRTATDRLTDVAREKSLKLVDDILGGDTSALPPELGQPTATDLTDGARMTFETGEIVTIRPSGNAPELRAYVEADGMARAEGLLRDVLVLIQRRLD